MLYVLIKTLITSSSLMHKKNTFDVWWSTDMFFLFDPLLCACACELNFTSSGVCDTTTANVPPLSAAHVHACMSRWPGEGCALHFNIRSLTTDICTGFFPLFLFFDFFPPPHLALSESPSFLTIPWERRITSCKKEISHIHKKHRILLKFKGCISYPTLKELIENQCSNCCQWTAVRIDRINQGRLWCSRVHTKGGKLIHTKKLSGFTESWLLVKALEEAKNKFFPHALCHIKYL